jgi:hypothetical protein
LRASYDEILFNQAARKYAARGLLRTGNRQDDCDEEHDEVFSNCDDQVDDADNNLS